MQTNPIGTFQLHGGETTEMQYIIAILITMKPQDSSATGAMIACRQTPLALSNCMDGEETTVPRREKSLYRDWHFEQEVFLG